MEVLATETKEYFLGCQKCIIFKTLNKKYVKKYGVHDFISKLKFNLNKWIKELK
jgi:hypothetical protein